MRGEMIGILRHEKWRRLSVNVFSLTGVHLANNLLPFLTVPYVVRIIGPDKLGLLNFSTAFIQYFLILIGFGFDVSIVRKVSLNKGNMTYINSLFNAVIATRVLLLVLCTCLFFGLVLSISELREHVSLHICTFLCCIGITFFPSWLYQGLEDLKYIALVNLLVKMSYVVGILLFVKHQEDFIYQNLFIGITHGAGGLVAYYIAIKRYKLTVKLVSLKEILSIIREARTLFFSSIPTNIYSACHPILIGLFCSIQSVGLFTAASRLQVIINAFIVMAFNQALFPVIAGRFGLGKEAGLATVGKVVPVYVVTSLIIVAVIQVTAPTLIYFIYGDNFTGSILTLRILGVIPIFTCLSTLLGVHVMLNLKLDGPYLRINGACYTIGLVISYWFVKRYEYLGAALGWVATEILIVVVMLLYIRKRHIYVFKELLNPDVWKSQIGKFGTIIFSSHK